MTVKELYDKLEVLMDEGFKDHKVSITIPTRDNDRNSPIMKLDPAAQWTDGVRKTAELEI